MKSLIMLWGLLLLISTFVFPQLIAVMLHFRLVQRSRWLAGVLGFLVPPVLFFFLAPHFFFAGVREAERNGPVPCGMPALAAAMMVLAGTVAQLIVSLPVQLYLFRRHKRS